MYWVEIVQRRKRVEYKGKSKLKQWMKAKE